MLGYAYSAGRFRFRLRFRKSAPICPPLAGRLGEWRPIIGADCRPVAIMELTSEDAVLLLIASENVHLKLKRARSGVHEINQSRGQCGEYHQLFPLLKADRERFFQCFRMDIETFTYILGKIEHRFFKNGCDLH